jgi:predicted DNA-binding transcriptional regulator YafY
MPRNAEVIRQWQILREIESSRRATIDRLAERTGVTTRTIRRDVEALQVAGFPLYDEVVEGKRYWTLDTRPFKALGDTGFSLAELCALYVSRTLLECLAGTPFHDDLARAFGKIEAALPPRMRRFFDRLPGVLAAKAGPVTACRAGRQSHDTIAKLLEATLQQRRATIDYDSFSSRRTKRYLIEPYRLVFADGGLYLLADVPEYGEIRTFALERIQRLSLLEETFVAARKLPAEAFPHSLGINQGPPEHVEIAFAASATPYLRERIWHPSQSLAEAPDGGAVMTLEVCDDPALHAWILGFGPLARVLAPAHLADRIRGDLEAALRRYPEERR